MLEALLSGDIRTFMMSLLFRLPIVLLALCLHETAHGFVAYKLGDPTAKALGRLTLNPLKHLDPIGFGCMVLFGFGWAKPVPIDTRYFKDPKKGMALTAAAGPVSNILLAFVFAILLRIMVGVLTSLNISIISELGYWVIYSLQTFLLLGIRLNLSLAVFNLIPIPPFDGSRIFLSMLPEKTYFAVMRYERYIYVAFLFVLAMGWLDVPISFLTDKLMDLLFLITF